MKKFFFIAFLLTANYFAQEINSSDTLAAFGVMPADSLALRDSLALPDTAVQSGKVDLDAIVYANSKDSLLFDVNSKMMYLFGKGEVKYKNVELKSGRIETNFETNDLAAFGIVDTSDTSKTGFAETPVLSEDSEVYEGTSLKYNFKSKRGFISMARNNKKDQRYLGERVKKVSNETFFIKDGIYTTCKEDPPHTHFSASEMKVIQKDKIIAKWIFLYIGGVPLPVPVPFAVFPNESGRRSGIIPPAYGDDYLRGQYFRNFGYFWAISDYLDFASNNDYYLKGGFATRGRFRYVKRYSYRGNINAGYSYVKSGEENDPNRSVSQDYNLSVLHNQQINPTTQLDANLTFQSRNFNSNNATQYDDLLRTDIVSNATLSKRWDESGNSLTINYNRNQKLQTGDITEDLPTVRFSKSQSYPFRKKGSAASADQKWYELIGYSYNSQFRNNRSKQNGVLNVRGGINHSLGVSASPKIGYFNISPRISYTEKWYNKFQKRTNYLVDRSTMLVEDGDTSYVITKADSLVIEDVHRFSSVRSFDIGVGASTKLYGMLQANTLGIEAFRHTIQPTISYSFSPDFSKDFWGYYDSYITADGKEVRYDRFSGQIFGGASSGERQNINMSLDNIFEMKTLKDPTDTTSEAQKIRLLNLSGSISYNFAADSLKLSQLSLSYRTDIGNLLNLSGSSSYTFYDYIESRQVNQFLASKGKGLFRLTNFSFSASTSISGEKLSGESRDGKNQDIEEEDNDVVRRTDYIALYEEQPPDFTIPWDLSLNYNYNLSKPTPDYSTVNSGLGLSMNLNITKNWKVSLRGNYDFQRKEISAPDIRIYRDLECWEMNFSWKPIGRYRGFRFELRIKAPELQDLKVTRSKGLYSGR
ncbi:MAG: LPS-assembly protein LptD [Ignavibacteriales bacterium]|nr:LPS-assembly protein LptD [Ignavibacteriales bacterium]MCF8314683.1 LPS-assembly protein LptD [Ignavibacteriales bacterium]MCF8436280.1 LPS-assembly protein LptD [Ignavibacteriales bacterium]